MIYSKKKVVLFVLLIFIVYIFTKAKTFSNMEYKNFTGKLIVENIMTNNSGETETTIYNGDKKIAKSNTLGYLQDSLYLNNKIYLAFSNGGAVHINLSDMSISEMPENFNGDVSKFVTNNKMLYYAKNYQTDSKGYDNKVCRMTEKGEEQCRKIQNDYIDNIEFYNGYLYIATRPDIAEPKTKILKVNPDTFEIVKNKDVKYLVSNSCVVNNKIYIVMNDGIAVYENGTFKELNIVDDAQGEKSVSEVHTMKSLGNHIIMQTNENKVLTYEPQKNELEILLQDGRIMNVVNDSAILMNIHGSTEEQLVYSGNVNRYEEKSGRMEKMEELPNRINETYYFY